MPKCTICSLHLGNGVRRAKPPDQVGIEEEGVLLRVRLLGDHLRGREEDLQAQGRRLGRGQLPGQALLWEGPQVRDKWPGVRQVRCEHRVSWFETYKFSTWPLFAGTFKIIATD